ncbi:MAG TPA: NfeD family protein [Candidatus Bariatricus faecipullorum]|nr:NfeD family protein [Candidatus Bariatricus faecipullorum]
MDAVLTWNDSYTTIAWLALLIVLLVIEIITVGLTSIWAAGGALVALLLNIAGVSLLWQVIAFFVVTFVLLVFTRPFAVRFINSRREKTNYEGIIGKTIRIVERVDNLSQTGMAVVNGQEWTVRSEDDAVILEPGTIAKVTGISGVKLIVKKYEED